MPKLEYSAYFEHGLLGVKCTEDIGHREAFMYIPYKMVFSVQKAKDEPNLGPVLEAYPSLFDPKKNQAASDQLILLAFIYVEMQKGKNSYWYPWFRMLPDVDFSCGWSSNDLDNFQDNVIVEQLYNYEICIHNEWQMFK